MSPVRRESSSTSVASSAAKSPSWLTSMTSPDRCAIASSVRLMPMSTTFSCASPDSGIGWKPIARSACTKLIGSEPLEAFRKKSPFTSWPHCCCANASTRSQRGRWSGAGRAPRIAVPSVASMFSPSTTTYVVPDPVVVPASVLIAPG